MVIRKIFESIVHSLKNDEILLLIGPRQVGKTTLLKSLASQLKVA